jgi:hypothetical protein
MGLTARIVVMGEETSILVNIFIVVVIYIRFYIHLVHAGPLWTVISVTKLILVAAPDALTRFPQLLLLLGQAGWDTNGAKIQFP